MQAGFPAHKPLSRSQTEEVVTFKATHSVLPVCQSETLVGGDTNSSICNSTDECFVLCSNVCCELAACAETHHVGKVAPVY